jgi:hypothetical protein
MPRLYREIAASGGCILSTSVREGLPLTLLEAQASGCTVVASDVQGNDECVSAEHGGLLYPAGMDGDAVAELIRDALGDSRRLREWQRAAAAYARERFGLARMAEHYLRIYADPPSGSSGDTASRIKARLRLSPLVHWSDYVEQRWGVGYEQFASSRVLAQRGEWRLAAGAGSASLRTSPTLFLKPQRLAHLVWVWMRASGAATALRAPAAGSERY